MRKLFGMVWFGASLAFAWNASAPNANPQMQRHSERQTAADAAARIIVPSTAETGARRLTPAAMMPIFDAATLPPIEAITATTDVSAFLALGVPRALKRAALRRVWVIDPNIRDFVSLQDNDWDFNHPDTIAGFGLLASGEHFERQVAKMFDEANRGTGKKCASGLVTVIKIFSNIC